MTRIRVKRTITLTDDIPFNENYYSGMTLEEARNYEYDLPMIEKIQQFVQLLDGTPEGKIDFGEVITIVED